MVRLAALRERFAGVPVRSDLALVIGLGLAALMVLIAVVAVFVAITRLVS